MTQLRQQMIDEMQLRNLSERTQEAYLHAVTKLATYYHRSPDQITEKEVRDYLLYEINERKLSWSSIHQKMNGLVFFYRRTLKRPPMEFCLPPQQHEQTLPEVLGKSELERLFDGAENPKHRIMFKTAYAGGLRLNEILHLQVTDIDSDRMMMRIRQGKGNKDRLVPLSSGLLRELREYWKLYRPKRLLFPARNTDEPMDESTLQRAIKKAKERAGIKKRGSVHMLRHSYATHLLEAGEDLRTIQVKLGHGHINSTQRYLQIAQPKLTSSLSPYDLLRKKRRRK